MDDHTRKLAAFISGVSILIKVYNTKGLVEILFKSYRVSAQILVRDKTLSYILNVDFIISSALCKIAYY